MKATVSKPVNTLEKAIGLAQVLSRDLTHHEPKTLRNFRMFQALTRDNREAFAAFLIWKARAQMT